MWDDLLGTLCNPGHVGDMLTSASPGDPTFWINHGAVDRLLMYRRLTSELGLRDFDDSWGYTHELASPSDTGIVCDWSGTNR